MLPTKLIFPLVARILNAHQGSACAPSKIKREYATLPHLTHKSPLIHFVRTKISTIIEVQIVMKLSKAIARQAFSVHLTVNVYLLKAATKQQLSA